MGLSYHGDGSGKYLDVELCLFLLACGPRRFSIPLLFCLTPFPAPPLPFLSPYHLGPPFCHPHLSPE